LLVTSAGAVREIAALLPLEQEYDIFVPGLGRSSRQTVKGRVAEN